MPPQFNTFEPSGKMRSVYEGLLASFGPWGALNPSPILFDKRIKRGPPATIEALLEVQRFLQSSQPQDLDRFWQVSDGLQFHADIVVFSTQQFLVENKRMRTLTSYMPFEGLYFIGSIGDGDMFATGRTLGGDWPGSVIIWEHETDRRYQVADSLAEYVAKLLLWWIEERTA
jgi:hypothetical protein